MPHSTNGHKPPELKWGRYARVSSAEQSGPDTTSIEDQLRFSEQIVAREGGVLVDTYVDDKGYVGDEGHKVQPSGERADRPEWRRLLADLKQGRINAIAAFHTWRLYRDFPPHADFIVIARKVKPVVKLWHGEWSEQFSVFGAWMGHEDNKHRTAQTAKGRLAWAKRGYPPTNMPRFYKTLRDDNGKRIGIALRDEHRPWLDELARLFLDGQSYDEIARALATNPTTGRRLHAGTVCNLVHNPFMLGFIDIDKRSRRTETDRTVVRGEQPPAWDAPTVAALQAEVARRRAMGHSVPHHGSYLFSGILRCGYCGRLMRGGKRGGKRGGGQPFYGCSHAWRISRGYAEGPPHPPNHISERKALLIVKALGQNLTREMALERARLSTVTAPAKPPSETERSRLRDEMAEVDAELAALPANSRRARLVLEDDHQRLAERLATLEAQAAAPAAYIPPEARAQAILDFYAHFDEQAPPEQLRPGLVKAWEALYIKHGELVDPASVTM